jgi:hypothetical protein
MSDLSRVQEFLDSKCLCHAGSNLTYALESLPSSIRQPKIKLGCDCRHGQEKDIKRALRQFKTFIETEARFKVGDRVELAITPEINERDSWGWMCSKHFLVEGAIATVREIDYRGDFGYSIVFDNESWKDRDGVIHPTKDKHTYYFAEEKLRPAGSITSRSCDFLKSLWRDFYKVGD